MLINKGFDADKIFTFGKGDIEPLKEEEKKYGEAVNYFYDSSSMTKLDRCVSMIERLHTCNLHTMMLCYLKPNMLKHTIF